MGFTRRRACMRLRVHGRPESKGVIEHKDLLQVFTFIKIKSCGYHGKKNENEGRLLKNYVKYGALQLH
jgi:hypothetical protein